MKSNKMIIGRILTATILAASVALISFAAPGCVMQTETEDFGTLEIPLDGPYTDTDALSMEDTVTQSEFETDLDALPPECLEGDNCVIVEELVIEAKPAPNASLEVGLDHFAATFTVIDQYFEVVIEDEPVRDCPVREQSYYHVCTLELPVGSYIVKFSYVDGYESPDDVIVDLTEAGTATYGSYADEHADEYYTE